MPTQSLDDAIESLQVRIEERREELSEKLKNVKQQIEKYDGFIATVTAEAGEAQEPRLKAGWLELLQEWRETKDLAERTRDQWERELWQLEGIRFD